MDPLRIAIRCLFAFVYLLAVVRLSGKRAVSEGTAFDLVLALILGDLVDDVIYGEVAFANFATAAGVLVFIEITISILVQRVDKLMWWVEGRPGLILEQGELNRDVLRYEKMNEQDVNCLMRLRGVEQEKWHQIRLATIEADGQQAVLKRRPMQDARRSDKTLLKTKR